MASGLQKRVSLNYFDPEVQTRNPPPPPKKEKKRTSILEIAQRSNSMPAEENVSVFSGVETKRRQSKLRKSKVKGNQGSKSVDYAVYRLDTPNLAAKVNQDTDIDLSFSDLGYLAHLYKNSLNRGHLTNDNIDSPATTKRKFHTYVGHPKRSLNPDLYESVNYDLLQMPKERRRKDSMFVQSPRKSLAEEVNNRPSLTLTPNLIVMKKPPGSRRSLSPTKRVKGEQKNDKKRKSHDNRKASERKIDLRDPLPGNDRKNSVQYLVEPPPPNFVLAKRDSRKSTSSRNSVRFSVVEDAMELAEQLDKSKKGKNIKKGAENRRKSQTSYTEAEFVEGSSDRDQEIEALRIQLQKSLAPNPASRDISPDSDYISNSSNRHSRSSSPSSSGSSSTSSSGSSSSESDSRSGSSSGSSSSSRSSSRSRSSSSSGSSRSSSSSRSESDQDRNRKNNYKVKSQEKQTKQQYEDDEVHDGKMLLGDASKPPTKKSIICVIL